MCPVIMSHNNRPVLAAGASGGRRILGAVFQVLTGIADFGMSVEQAAHHPRIDVSSAEECTADQRLAPDILAGLAEDGPLAVVEQTAVPVNFACPNVILRGPDGVATGISDFMSPWSAAVAR
jgi:gamma-glutamyltranspeptidase/glutathione hydrolase